MRNIGWLVYGELPHSGATGRKPAGSGGFPIVPTADNRIFPTQAGPKRSTPGHR